MRARDLVSLQRSGNLLGRCAVIKPNSEYGAEGVEGGVIIGSTDAVSLWLAIHGRVDDRLWVDAGVLSDVNDEDWWDLDTSQLQGEIRQTLIEEVGLFPDAELLPELRQQLGLDEADSV